MKIPTRPRDPVSIEREAQRRARRRVITGPDRPIIASRPFDPSETQSPEAARNAQRIAEFHARWRGQREPRLQLWRP